MTGDPGGPPARRCGACATPPVSGLRAQICGDAHLGNFGGYATPERNLIFDRNDFDETIDGPWEWDVKRLAVSAVVGGREIGCSEKHCRQAARAAVRAYRLHMREPGVRPFFDVWSSRGDTAHAIDHVAGDDLDEELPGGGTAQDQWRHAAEADRAHRRRAAHRR